MCGNFAEYFIVNMVVLWDVAPCNLVDIRRFRAANCLITQRIEVVSTSETPVIFYEATQRNILEESNF